MDQQHMMAALAAPFPPGDLGWVPGVMSKTENKAQALVYIDARSVMDRLDLVFGVDGWSTKIKWLDGGVCQIRLSVAFKGNMVYREDVGHNENIDKAGKHDIGIERKGAVSDALKRVAVQIGIGRYLYNMPKRWYGYANYKWSEDIQVSPEYWPMEDKLASYDKKLSDSKVCSPGEFMSAVYEYALSQGFSENPIFWTQPEVAKVRQFTGKFESERRQSK